MRKKVYCPRKRHNCRDRNGRWCPFIHLGGERQCGVKFIVQGNNTTVETLTVAGTQLYTWEEGDNAEKSLLSKETTQLYM